MVFENLKGKKYDHTLKWMAEQESQSFFDWLMEVLGREQFVLTESDVSKELAPATRLVDLVWRILTALGTAALLHVELQLEPDDEMGRRMLEYGMRLYERDHLPILAVVIFLKRIEKLPTPPFIISLDNDEIFRYSYSVVRLWEVPQELILKRPSPILWPLAGLMADTPPDSVAAVGQQIAKSRKVKRPLKEELIGYLGLLAGVQLENAEVRAALRRHPMVNELWQHSSVAQALKEEGREEGQKEGRVEEAREMAQIALEDRFGSLSEEVLAALKGADVATLKTVITAKSMQDVRTRLGLS